MSIAERELTPAEKKQLKKYEKEISKKDFTKRYGKKEGTKIYYATLTKMAKEKVEEMYSSVAGNGHVRINVIKGGEEHAGRVERARHQGLRNVMEDELEEKKDRRGASPSYCKNTPCDKMGFTQKASCKSQGIKDCYRGKKKNEEVELQERCQKGYKTHPKRKTKKMFGRTYRNCIKAEEGSDPKVGTGKKPKGSGRRLYTDEDPSDTVSVEFSSVAAIKRTLAKKSFKSKSHKRQSQIINLIHQRARAAYKNAKDPKVKARLKKAFEYAEQRKEASKKKTIRLRKKKK